MTRSRRYLNNLPNAKRIKALALDILDYELKLDRAVKDNARIKNEVLTLETQILLFDGKENSHEDSQKIKDMQSKLNELTPALLLGNKEITYLKKDLSDSKALVDEEIKKGLSQLFQQAKSNRDDAQQDIIKHQKMVEEAQNRLMNSPAPESQKNHDEWIRNVKRVIEDEEKIKNCEKQLEAIKRVYRLEFG